MESIYGEQREQLKAVMNRLQDDISEVRKQIEAQTGIDPVEHCLARIKSEESMREKCRRKGLPETPESALEEIHDAIGLRVVCAFLDDVYAIRDFLAGLPHCEIVEEKDYIRHAKPNGYRSYHMILRVDGSYYAEIQLRTISMDTWAALEHHLKYKKQVPKHVDLIVKELKRCADELASTDVSMQTIRDMISGKS
ncbi:MAG: GTP pyrophosphokinase family protein [Blautia sp.]|nr:GTP pyrophosphokinase family protein [Blautia sp.]